MKRNQIHIFATKADLASLLQAIELQRELQFVRAGLFDVPVLNRVTTLFSDANLGIAIKGDNNHEARFLVADRQETIKVETVAQHGGGTKYAIGNQKVNPKTILFWPGGVFGGTSVIAGSAGTISEDVASLAIFRLFSKEIKRQFKKINSYYVGTGAQEMLAQGCRLTTGIKTPPLYDLKRE